MGSKIKTEELKIVGMTCVSCENRIERKLNDAIGIMNANVNYNNGTAQITYKANLLKLEDIIKMIETLGYQAFQKQRKNKQKSTIAKILGTVIIIFSLSTIMQRFGLTNIFNSFPQAEASTGYGMLFFIGLLTSVHCISMCGGINLSQCIPQNMEEGNKSTKNTKSRKNNKKSKGGRLASLRPSILYNSGRVVSYTVVGAIVGALGSVVSFSGSTRGIVQLAAGIFMVIMGLNMLNLFPWLRKLNPRMPKVFARKINGQKLKSNSPFYIGLLNGLMPCGPLQAMQLYALSTGDPLKGALSMFLFSLGTIPLMFGLGALSSVLSRKFTNKVMTVGAVLVVVLGVSMFNTGLSLSGVSVFALNSSDSNESNIENGIQSVTTALSYNGYEAITVQAGIPVKWTITAEEETLNNCNNEIIVSEYGIEQGLEIGDNVIEFTPTETGIFTYSCWMGMIRSTITVVDEDGAAPSSTTGTETDTANDSTIVDEPMAAGYIIPTDEIAIAEVIDDVQYVTIDMTETRFTPAVIVVQSDVKLEFTINAETINDGSSTLFFPLYYAQILVEEGENINYFYPSEDFEFSTSDYSFYGYVKVVDDIENIDIEAIKEEVNAFETTIWNWNSGGDGFGSGDGLSCH